MSKDLEGKCGTCQSRCLISRGEMNVPQKQVYKGRVLRCENSNSRYCKGIVLPKWACDKYRARY